ncbi:Oligosaccharyltransferase complex [Klebsormidium nitens]|uniref:Oligosaccharyltransferase complex n=1 Tax=Klebsormidium nitens TaxID=105231 RepID=A0A1Y1HQ00_KLENI|nr:Oligosaccharyltransferase complex [Klebsormidium nitens]|eukprot:GAQ79061.1 Oligosaccharyltransferase complex [Klebsormidium nitens]
MALLVRLAAALALLLLLPPAALAFNERAEDLLDLQQGSRDGVIHFKEDSFDRYVRGSEPRGYSLVLFYAAKQVADKPELGMPALRKDFGLVAQSYQKTHKGTPEELLVFFADVEFSESPNVFADTGVNAVPHIRRFPSVGDGSAGEDTFDLNSFPRTAEGIASFVEARTKLKVGEIVRPPPLSKLQVSLILAAVLLLGPYIGYKVLSLPAVQEPKLWAIAAIGVYYFSVSGGMYNIIRGIPWATADERGKPVFFHQGQGYQLGGEGFYAGLFYLVTSLLLFIMTYVVPRLKSKSSQRIWSAICLFLGFWVVTQFVALYKWKSGYYVHGYWPRRR